MSDDVTQAIRDTERYLSRLCMRRLPRAFSQNVELAIVGGAARDLVRSRLGLQRATAAIRDVDIALLCTPNGALRSLADAGSMERNRYGGWKCHLRDGLALDLWRWDAPRSLPSMTTSWAQWLERVDFDINAVAFLWPQRRIVSHPAWLEALRRREITPLSREPLDWRRDTLRALGLHCRWSTSPYVSSWMLQRLEQMLQSQEGMNGALSYFTTSVAKGRYPQRTRVVLADAIRRDLGASYSARFDAELWAASGKPCS